MTTPPPATPRRLFISYARKDLDLLRELENHFRELERQGLIAHWTDQALVAGEAWEPKLLETLQRADVILLLVSADFMASDYIHRVELKEALERHERGEAQVVPIVIRPVDLTGSPLDRLQALPPERRAVTTWRNRDQAWVEVVKGLRRVLEVGHGSGDSRKIGDISPATTARAIARRADVPPLKGSGETRSPKLPGTRTPGLTSGSITATSAHIEASPARATSPEKLTDISDSEASIPSAPSIKWLHLSDLHFRAERSWRQDVVLEALIRDVLEPLEPDLAPDLVFVTGDIANSGKPAEYARAREFFEEVARVTGCDLYSRWFIAPGNHDVDRSAIKKTAWKQMPEDEEELDTLLDDPETFRLHFTSRQQAFFDFTGELFGPERAWTAERPWRVDTLEVSGLTLAILGLNSAWTCGRDNERGQLLLGERPLRTLLHEAADHAPHLRIALQHHPLEWLQEFDQQKVQGLLESPGGPQVLLRGHLHKQRLRMGATPDGHVLELAAGACWAGSSWPHGVNLVRLEPVAGRGEVHLWRYADEGRGFWKRDNFLYERLEGGVWGFDLPKEWKLADSGETSRPANALLAPPPLLQLWRVHLTTTRASHTHIKLYGIRRQGRAVQIQLTDVYVELSAERSERFGEDAGHHRGLQAASGRSTGGNPQSERGEPGLEPGRQGAERLLLHHVLARSRRALLIGDPGSGKTTLLRYVARVLADAWLEPAAAPAARVLFGLPADAPLLIPFFSVLADLDAYLDRLEVSIREVCPEHLIGFLLDLAWKSNARLERSTLEQALEEGRLLLLLDGLDEIPSHKDRRRAIHGVASLLERFPTLPALLTSRTRAVREDLRAELPTLDLYALQPMMREEMERFLHTWHRALHPADAGLARQEAATLFSEILSHPQVLAMADTPNILTLIAVLRQNQFRLPERRVDLYSGVIDLFLLRDEDSHVIEVWDSFVQDLDPTVKRKLLSNLALSMHEKGNTQGRTLPVEAAILSFARDLNRSGRSGDESTALRDGHWLLDWLEQRSGLLVRRDGGVMFAHLGFQEQLVGEALATLEGDPLWEAVTPHIEDDWWNEPIRLLLAKLEGRAGALLQRLIHAGESIGGNIHWPRQARGIALAMGGLQDIQPELLEPEARKEMLGALEALLEAKNSSKAADRIEALTALGRVGDPRLGLEKPDRWVWIAPGEFTMGSYDYTWAKPPHRVQITRGFWLGKYPVTNQEYREFVKDGGYCERKWWSEEGWAWQTLEGGAYATWFRQLRERDKRIKEAWQDEFRPGSEPRFWVNEQLNGSNQPVVGVSWHEARAFSLWLSERWQTQLPLGLEPAVKALDGHAYNVRLPTEAEWEFVAAGTRSRRYPWGEDEPDAERANFDKNVGRTSPVGVYSLGATPEGVHDMAGNVWEWCVDTYDDKAYQDRSKITIDPIVFAGNSEHVLRGGAWFSGTGGLRAAFRSWYWASNRFVNVGFRIVLGSVSVEHDSDLEP